MRWEKLDYDSEPINKGFLSEQFVGTVIETYPFTDGTALDIGANVGEYTKKMIQRFKHVIAFEPHPATAQTLEKNLLASGGNRNWQICQKAVGSSSGLVDFWTIGDGNNSGGNTISKNVAAQEQWGHRLGMKRPIEAITLDQAVALYDIKDLKFMKIDVEGAENFLFLGAINTMTSFKLDIVLEVHQTVDVAKLYHHLTQLGYIAFNTNYKRVNAFQHDRHYLLTNKV